MLGIGSSIPSLALGVRAAAAPELLPIGARMVFAGDSKFGFDISVGARNIQVQTVDRLSGRVRLAVAGDQGISGNTIAQLTARISHTIAQQADITIIGIGHNSLSLGAATCISQMQTLHDQLRAGLGTRLIIWTTILPSATSAGGLFPAGHATLVAVNDWIMGLDQTDGGKTRSVNFGYRTTDPVLFDPLTMCYPEGTSPITYLHPNVRGAVFTGGVLAGLLDGLITPQSITEALNDIVPGNGYGADLDPIHVFAGTSGAKAGSTLPTGDVANGCTVTNNTTCAVACSMGTLLGYPAQIIDITGAASAENTILFTRQNVAGARIAWANAIGDFGERLVGYRISSASNEAAAPVGLLQYGNGTGGGTRGRLSLGTVTATDANLGGAETAQIGPRVARTMAACFINANRVTHSGDTWFGVRVAAGTVNIRLYLIAPIARLVDRTAYALPFYAGVSTIQNNDERLGNTSNLTNLVIGTSYTFRPGLWSGGGLTITNLLEISTNGGTSWAPVSGTTNNGYTWTAAGASGNLIRQTVTASNSFGTTTAVWNGALA